MARHRNIRKMRYEDELSNDEYGYSYDDLKNYAVSPDTEEMFTYNRAATKEHTLSSFIEEQSLNEEEQFASDEDDIDPNADYKMPELNEADQAKLQLGLESLEGILGENCHQPTAVDALMRFNYDIEKALDDILSKGGRQTLSLETKPSSKSKDSQKISLRNFSKSSIVSPGNSCVSLENEKETIVKCNGVRPGLHNETRPESGTIVHQQQFKPIGNVTATRGHSNRNLMNQPLSSLASVGVTKFNGLSGLVQSPLVSKIKKNSLDQRAVDKLVKKPLSLVESNGVAKSDGLSGLMKPSHASKMTTTLLGQHEKGKLMEQSLSSLAYMKEAKSNGLSGLVKPSLTSKLATNSLTQSERVNLMKRLLVSPASIEETKLNGHSGCLKPSFTSKLAMNSLGGSEKDNLMSQSLSSLASAEETKLGFVKPSLASNLTTNSLGKSEKDNLMNQSLSSLASAEVSKSDGFSGFMKPLHTSTVATNSSGQSLRSLASIEVSKSDDLSGFMKPSLTSIVTTSSSGQFLSSLASIEVSKSDARPSIDLPSPGSIVSLECENGALPKTRHGIESNNLYSGGTLATPLTPLKNPACSDLAVRSGDKFSSEMGTTSLNSLAWDDKSADAIERTASTTHVNAFAKLAGKVGQKGVLSAVSALDVDSIYDKTGASVTEMVSGQSAPLMQGPGKGRTCEGTSPNCVKKMSTSLKKLSLESSLKSFPNRTDGVTDLHSINKRLNENGRHPKSSIEISKSTVINHNPAFDAGSFLDPTSIIRDYEDTVMKSDSNFTLKSIPTFANRIRKRKASLFGQALSALHEPKVKFPRGDPLYDNKHGFALPVTVDLRGLLDSNDKLNVFNFSVPSQDDLVQSKQSKAFSKKKRSQLLPDAHAFFS